MSYTPTTEQVKRYWLYGANAWSAGVASDRDVPDPVDGDLPSAQFDRWLAEHDREVAAQALRTAAAQYAGDWLK